MPSGAYQRVLVNGVPYWKDSSNVLYLFESNTPPNNDTRRRIGTVSGGIDPTWKDDLHTFVEQYRASLQPRARGPAAAPKS